MAYWELPRAALERRYQALAQVSQALMRESEHFVPAAHLRDAVLPAEISPTPRWFVDRELTRCG